MVIPNVWELNHDREIFGPDSFKFNPTRYLDEKGQVISGPPGTKEDGHFSFGTLPPFLLVLLFVDCLQGSVDGEQLQAVRYVLISSDLTLPLLQSMHW